MSRETLGWNTDQVFFRQCIIHGSIMGGRVTAQATMSGVLNGVDVERLGQTLEAVQQNPNVGASQFRAVNCWISEDTIVPSPVILFGRPPGSG